MKCSSFAQTLPRVSVLGTRLPFARSLQGNLHTTSFSHILCPDPPDAILQHQHPVPWFNHVHHGSLQPRMPGAADGDRHAVSGLERILQTCLDIVHDHQTFRAEKVTNQRQWSGLQDARRAVGGPRAAQQAGRHCYGLLELLGRSVLGLHTLLKLTDSCNISQELRSLRCTRATVRTSKDQWNCSIVKLLN